MPAGSLDRMLAGRPGLSPIMVGRSAALRRLAALLPRPSTPTPSAVPPQVALVAGEAGVGKSRLLRELLARAEPDVVLLGGGADAGSLGRPFEVVEAILGGPLPATPAASVPAYANRDERVDEAAAAVRARFGASAGVAVFEDLHWADAGSVATFERLAATTGPPLLLVGSFRPEELTRRLPFGDMLTRLERRHAVVTIRLDRLTRLEVGHLVAAIYDRPAPSRAVDVLYDRTGGNPFFIEELLAAAGDVDPSELAGLPLPWSLAEVVRVQLDGLDPDQRRVVDAAAVLGRRASFDVLSTVTRTGEDELIAILRGLVERGLMVEAAPDEFAFRHALVRDAVEGQLLARERRRLHERALAALEEAGVCELADLAWHAAGAGHTDRLVELARQGAVSYLRRGATHQALRLAEEGLAEVDDDTELLAAASRAAWLLGLWDEALAHARRWRDVAEVRGDVVGLSAVSRLLVRLHWEAGDEAAHWEAVAELGRLVEQLEPCEERAAALAMVAQAHMLAEHAEDAVAWADRALVEAEACGSRAVRAQALVEKGTALHAVDGRRDEGIALLREGIRQAEAIGEHVVAARALNNLGEFFSVHSREGRVLVDRLFAAAERAGYDAMTDSNYLLKRFELAASDGDLDSARAALAEIDAVTITRRCATNRGWRAGAVARMRIEEGRFDEALDVLRRVDDRLESADAEWLAELAFEATVRAGDAEGARAQLAAITARPFRPKHAVWPESVLEPLLAALDLGADPSQLDAWLSSLEGRLAGLPWWPLARAVGDANAGRWHVAADRLATGLAEPGELELPAYLLGEPHGLAARALAQVGRVDAARAQALAGLAALATWPGWRRDRVAAALAALGPADGADGVDGAVRARVEAAALGGEAAELTAREREVAALVAEGLTNAQVARRLRISPKTAAVHVSNILTKLGVANRAELAAWAVRAGLAGAAAP